MPQTQKKKPSHQPTPSKPLEKTTATHPQPHPAAPQPLRTKPAKTLVTSSAPTVIAAAAPKSSGPIARTETLAASTLKTPKVKTKLPSHPSAAGKQFLARLRKEVRAEARRAEKLSELHGQAEALRLKKEEAAAASAAELARQQAEALANGTPPPPPPPPASKNDRRLPVDPELKLLQGEVRRLLDEVAHAVSRVVSSRLSLTLGDQETIGKIDLLTDERAFSPKPTRAHGKEVQALARNLFEVLDSSLHELEQALRVQYKKVSELKNSISSLR